MPESRGVGKAADARVLENAGNLAGSTNATMIAIIMMCMSALNSVVRTSVGLVSIKLTEDAGWLSDGPEAARIFFVFFLGFAVSCYPMGMLTARYGGYAVLACCSFGWSISLALLPRCFDFFTESLLAGPGRSFEENRGLATSAIVDQEHLGSVTTAPLHVMVSGNFFVIGMFCAGIVPATSDIITSALSPRWRPVAVAYRSCGFFVGRALSTFLFPFCTDAFGWRKTCVFFCTLGIAGFLLWVVVGTLYFPTRAGGPSAPAVTAGSGSSSWPVLKILLSSPGVYALIYFHIAINFGSYMCQSYLPSYFIDFLGVNFGDLSRFLIPTQIGQLLGSLAGMRAMIFVWERQVITSLLMLRVFFVALASAGGGAFFVMFAFSRAATSASLWLFFACSFLGACDSFVNLGYIDIAPTHSSIMSGLSQTISAAPGILGPFFAAYIVSRFGSMQYLWVSAGCMLSLVPILFARFATVGDIFARKSILAERSELVYVSKTKAKATILV